MAFFGTYSPRLDDKGRLFLPAKFRDQLREGLVLTKGQEHCVYVWSLDDFAALTRQAQKASFTKRANRDFQRMLFSGAAEETPDKQGRISIPPVLRTWASLDRECVAIGAMDRVEIWDAGAWERYATATEESYAQMSEEVMPGIE